MAITLVSAQAQLDAWLAAELAAATGQSYSIGGRTLSRVDIGEIRSQVGRWSKIVDNLTYTTGNNSSVYVAKLR